MKRNSGTTNGDVRKSGVFSHQRLHSADQTEVAVNDDVIVTGVVRTQDHPPLFREIALAGRFVFEERHHNVTGTWLGITLNQNQVARLDGFRHTVTLNLEKEVFLARIKPINGEGQFLHDIFLGQDRRASGHLAYDWNQPKPMVLFTSRLTIA